MKLIGNEFDPVLIKSDPGFQLKSISVRLSIVNGSMKIYQLTFLVIFFVFSLLCSVTVSAGKDFEFDTVQDYEDDYTLNVDAGGTVVPEMKPARAREKFSVIFENKYDNETVDLFWVSETGEEFSMGDIYSGNSVRIDTTVYHTFVGKGKQSKDFVNPRVVRTTSSLS